MNKVAIKKQNAGGGDSAGAMPESGKSAIQRMHEQKKMKRTEYALRVLDESREMDVRKQDIRDSFAHR